MTRNLIGLIVGGVLILGIFTACEERAQLSKPPAVTWDAFLDTLQVRTIKFFLDTTDPSTGLTPDRWPKPGAPSSIAAVGFALTAYGIAVEREVITREEAAQRTLNTLRFFWQLPQGDQPDKIAGYKGFFYHFLKIPEGTREWRCELSSIDTALLLAGVLFAQSYFDGDDQAERDIRRLADSLYFRADWNWFMADTNGVKTSWHPERGFGRHIWDGYDEAMILYILALGSPTHPAPQSVWQTWTKPYVWAKYYDEEFVSFGPLFGHQYSHCWIDFRVIQDAYMREKDLDYFENSRRATYSHQAYARENPRAYRDYSENIWGFTACDGPKDTAFVVDGRERTFWSYRARGVSFDWIEDDGTIAPTAAGGSIAFAPEICIPALKTMRAKYGTRLFKEYGFLDSFNPSFITPQTPNGWFDDDYLGIDQGPIVIMIENLRNGFVWKVMKKNPYIVTGLRRAGFSGGWLGETFQAKSFVIK
ncbi:MAG: Tat pathway signal protein [candidate division KSB1 bacterium]|nr:Tat pathway signal protein [candidate division KSB1 bacterium]MDZ7366550.1 Tat pathway signal protein [candidate division KSB1 bacterium]MDZ7405967.1 Tat pathway signal protein [candidate division KSB1 bacterium]